MTPPTKLVAEGIVDSDPSDSLNVPDVKTVPRLDTVPPEDGELVLVFPLGDEPPDEPPPPPPPSVNKVPVDEPANCVLLPPSAL